MIFDFITRGWKEMLGTGKEFERHQEIREKEIASAEIELGGAKCPKCGEGVLGDVDGLCQNCV